MKIYNRYLHCKYRYSILKDKYEKMSIEQIVKYSGGILFLLLTFIQISPIKINPWSWIGKAIGKIITQELSSDLKEIKEAQKKDHDKYEKRFTDIEKSQEDFQNYCKQSDAKNARRRILRFADELRMKIDHSQEFFHEILCDISFYEQYCSENPNFKNMKANVAIELIKETYQKCLKDNKFL